MITHLTENITIQEFVRRHMLPMSVKATDRNSSMEPDAAPMDHWRCTLRAPGGRQMTVVFSKGIGHKGALPEVEEVLSCLALDASGLENSRGSFADFCQEYGYDTDSIKAHKTFRACERQRAKLLNFLGADLYRVLIWETENLQ